MEKYIKKLDFFADFNNEKQENIFFDKIKTKAYYCKN